MEIVILLIPLALILLGIAIAAFFWAVRNDQFDDMESPAWRIIFEDRETTRQPETDSVSQTEKRPQEPENRHD